MDTWITSTGRKIPVRFMGDAHLDNAIKMLCRQPMKDRDHSKLLMLCKERNRRKDKPMAKTFRWCLSQKGGNRAHLVELFPDGEMSHVARCGVRQKGGKWTEQPESDPHQVCARCLALGDPKEEVHEASVNFLQVIGPAIPLCWIPVDDVKAVVMLLATHQPKEESLKIVQAQFKAVIGHLNEYIQEAEERNKKTEMAVTWTHSGEKQKGK